MGAGPVVGRLFIVLGVPSFNRLSWSPFCRSWQWLYWLASRELLVEEEESFGSFDLEALNWEALI